MSLSRFTAFAAGLCWTTAAVAGGTTISQHNTANVYGSVQVGTSTSVGVTQKGYANIAGVIQVSPKNAASIQQHGVYSGAAIGQISGRSIYRSMP